MTDPRHANLSQLHSPIGKIGTVGLSKKPFLVILSAVLAEALSGAKGKNLRNVDSTRVRRPFTSFRFTWARFFDSPSTTSLSCPAVRLGALGVLGGSSSGGTCFLAPRNPSLTS